MAKKPLSKVGSLILAASICASMLSVAGVSPLKTAAESTKRTFTADFSQIQDGVIDVNDSNAVNTIEKNFYVYNAQRNARDGYTSYFERGKVNDYLVNDQEQAKPRYPDTAAFPAWNLDGWDKHPDKTNAEKPIPLWRVDGKWLTCDAYSGSDAFLFRETNLLYVKGNTPSEFASFENFTAQMNVKFKPLSDSVAEGSDALVFVFRAMSAGQATDPNQTTVAISPSGDLYAGSLNWTETPAYNDTLKDATGNKVTLERDKEYRLVLSAQGTTLKLAVYDGDTLVGSCEKGGIRAGRGLLGFGGSNAGAYIADVEIARLDENGKIVDINDNGSGYGFGFDPQTIATFRYMYYVDNGSGTADTIWNNYYYRTDTDTYWINFWNNRRGEMTWFGDGFTKETATMNSLLGLYYEQNGTAGRISQKVSFSDRNGAEINLGDGTSGQTMYMDHGNRLLALQDNNNGPGYMLKEMTTFAPLTADGKDAQAENAELFFNTLLVSDNPQRTSAITFRSKEAGRMMADDGGGGYTGYADKLTVLLNGKGFAVYDSMAMPYNGDLITYTPWNGNAMINGGFVDVWAKLVGNKLYLKVSDANNVYYDNTSSPMTVNTTGEGYMYYTVLGGWGYITDFKAAQLDENGDRLPWNFKIGGEALSDLADQGLLKTVGRAGFVGDDFQMDWTNSGFEITGTLSGDVSMIAKRTDDPGMEGIDGCYVDVIVDGGEATRVKIPNGTNTVKLVSGLAEGKHTVRVLTANSAAFGTLSVSHVGFTGALEVPKTENSKLRILAIGDSITTGYGLYGKDGDSAAPANKIETSDGYYSYAAVAARDLDAELSVVANEAAPISEVHGFVNKLNRREGAPNWDWTKNKNDVIVINLGTNDEWISDKTSETALADAKALLDDMRAKNPDAEIIWVYGMMRKDYEASYKAAVQYMNDKSDSKVHILEMTPDTTALEGHPSKAAHAEYGKKLADYIRGLVGDTYAAHKDTLKALDDAGKLLIGGRNRWSDTALASTLGAAGFTVKGEIADDVVLHVKQADNMVKLAVTVDGTMRTVEVQPGESTVTLAAGLARGTHTIEVRRATSDTGMTELQSIEYCGTLTQPEKKTLQIEFLGDSITVGDGMLWEGNYDYVKDQNTMLGYAAQTAAKLNADFSMVAHSGITTAGMLTSQQQSYTTANETLPLNSNGKQIVVINLGTNDIGLPASCDTAALKTAIGQLLDAVIAQNDEHTCVVWAYGMMATKGLDVIKEAVESQANGRNIWFCDLSAAKDNAGAGEHPSQIGNDKAAEILTQFITDNCLPAIEAGHKLVKTEAKAATCQAEGNIEYYTCSICGKIFGDAAGTTEIDQKDTVTPKAAHKLDKTEKKDATHFADGNIEYYTCSVCRKLFSDADGKNEITQAQTVIDKIAHTYGDYQHDENGHWKECSCGDRTAEGAHTGGTATCNEQAECTVCGAKYGAVDKTKHGEAEVRDAKKATCTTDGYTGDTYCKDCGDKLATGTVIPAAHDLKKVEAKASTCTAEGNIEYYRCSVCGELFSDANGTKKITEADTVVAKAAHDLNKIEAKAATCTAEGNIEYYRCSVCGKLFSDAAGTQEIAAADTVIAKTAHKLNKVEAKAATAESEGNIEHYTCADCGKLFADAEGKKELSAADVVIAKLSGEDKPNPSDPGSNGDKSPTTGECFYPIALAVTAALAAVAALIAAFAKKKKGAANA